MPVDVAFGERTAVLELLARKDEAMLVRRDALLVLDLGLDDINREGLDGNFTANKKESKLKLAERKHEKQRERELSKLEEARFGKI
jgi:hypothetical protein